MDRLRVLTLNLWNKSGPWQQRLPMIRRGLEELAPDLVALQEVLSLDGVAETQAHEVAAGLGYHVAYGEATSVGHGLHYGNAVLSRYPIAATHNWPLPVEDGDPGRALLAVFIAAPSGKVPFFCTHLSWKLHEGAIRVRQVAAAVELIEQLAPFGQEMMPSILAGDLNAEFCSDELRYLAGYHAVHGKSVYFADCFHVAGDGSPGYTFARRNVYAAPMREPNRRIDYVFVRGPDRHGRGEPLAARVVLDEAEGGVFASDHFGVYAEISC